MDALNLIKDGWQELELGQPYWRWFVKGPKNAYIYTLTGQIFYADSFRDVTKQLPIWILSRGAIVQQIYFVDPTAIKRPRVIRGRLREGSGNFQNELILKIR